MEDITGLGKLAESKLANEIYSDGASPAMRELGGAAADLIKTVRLFTAPFQLAAVAQDRFKVWLDEVRSRVPADKQVEAPAAIAGPALRAMQFLEHDSPLAGMFVNLLAQAIHQDQQHGVHPAFVRVLEQLGPDEALLLTKFKESPFLGVNTLHDLSGDRARIRSLTTFPQEGFADPDSLSMYFEHLESLSLIRRDDAVEVVMPPGGPDLKGFRWHALTLFGSRFLSVCGQ